MFANVRSDGAVLRLKLSKLCPQRARVREGGARAGWGVSALSALRPGSGQALGAGKKGGRGCRFDRLRTGIHQAMTELGCCRKMLLVDHRLVAAFDPKLPLAIRVQNAVETR